MSEFRLEYSFEETVKKMTEEVQQKVDQEILDANAHVLEEFGYVKVVRCRDCYFADEIEGGYWCDRFDCVKDHVTPNGFCAWAVKRKEGGDD